MNVRISVCLWGAALAIPGSLSASPAPSNRFPAVHFTMNSGLHSNPGPETAKLFEGVASAPGAPWIRLHFADHNLGANSFLILTSLKDGGQQRLDARTLRQWANSSAYFNGEAVNVALHVAPGDFGVYVRTKQLTVGERSTHAQALPQPVSPTSFRDDRPVIWNALCGADDRVPSADPRVARIVPDVGYHSTAFVVSNGALLTAERPGDNGVVEFNVPASLCDGTPVHPGPQDQYSINPSTVMYHDQPVDNGDNWCVFGCYPNPNTGLLPGQAQEFYRMSKDDSPATVRVTGYGQDFSPLGCTGEENSDSRTQQTDTGPYIAETVEGPSDVEITYELDAPVSDGAPVIVPGTTMALGIHHYDFCKPPYRYPTATGFENDALENAIQTFPGPVVYYVDPGHPGTIKDGTVFRPDDTLMDGIVNVPQGGILSLVTGYYHIPIIPLVIGSAGRSMTMMAPVGTVAIGQ